MASALQDAWHYADHANGSGFFGRDYTRAQALRFAFREARRAGLVLSTVLFPRVLGSAVALQGAVERYGWANGVDAQRGRILPDLHEREEVIDDVTDRVSIIERVNVTYDSLGRAVRHEVVLSDKAEPDRDYVVRHIRDLRRHQSRCLRDGRCDC